ncbi:hypothetical protein IV203_008663 [Nitzschia inconspicua]|uniref:Uncharacterized protein n=1 Tax=Nitzschia inconspicua TaxID=303405 RepID=A0A9K3PM79_9STRA|nr:hypothetical protein IV203_008663 [Nitzschia inconspicua]
MKMERPSLTISTTIAVVAISAACIWRTIRRSRSPVIQCKLSCNCGKVQGYIAAKREDSIRIWCFCQDCQDYGAFVASQDKHAKNIVGEYGESRVVQVCKSDLYIIQGQDLLQLSRKSATPTKNQLYMHRYYTKCCHTPLFQTVDFLGFVGVFLENLDQAVIDQFDGPVAMMPEQASKLPPNMPPDIFVPHLLWKLIRYHSSRNLGPFDYDMNPTFWGDKKKTK